METNLWKRRAILFVQRFWQPTSACMTCMPGSWTNLWSLVHWELALRTGLGTGLLVLLLTFTPVLRLFGNRFGNAALVGALTVVGDAWSHPDHYVMGAYVEALATGTVSGLLALAASYAFEDRARRLRALWARVAG